MQKIVDFLVEGRLGETDTDRKIELMQREVGSVIVGDTAKGLRLHFMNVLAPDNSQAVLPKVGLKQVGALNLAKANKRALFPYERDFLIAFAAVTVRRQLLADLLGDDFVEPAEPRQVIEAFTLYFQKAIPVAIYRVIEESYGRTSAMTQEGFRDEVYRRVVLDYSFISERSVPAIKSIFNLIFTETNGKIFT